LIVPSTIVLPRDGSAALAFLGRVRVHDSIFSFALARSNLALKRIVALVSRSAVSFIYSHTTKQKCFARFAPGEFHKRSQEKNTSPLAGVFLAVQPTWLSRFVLAFRSGSSGRHYRCVALLVFFISVFHRLCATKPIGSETNKAATRLLGANHGSIGDSWPIAFSGGARGTRVA